MRITQKMMSNQVNSSLSKNADKLMKTQSRISSGKQITQASDDPVGMAKVLDYRKTIDTVDQYSRNISQAQSCLEAGESTLSDISETAESGQGTGPFPGNWYSQRRNPKDVAGESGRFGIN